MLDHANQWWWYHFVEDFDAQAKCWNQFWCTKKCKKNAENQLGHYILVWDIVIKTLQTCYFGNFGKIIALTCRKPSCSSACKKSTSSLTSFVRYCREIANLLFWVLWACLATNT